MNFVNNWRRDITLAAGAVSAALDLPNGTYRLTLADAVPPTRFEIIEAVVANGNASLTRGMEGTTDQNWPAGSQVFASVTAGILQALSQAGAGGGAAPIVSEDAPNQPPEAIGQLYLRQPFEAPRIVYVASGTTSPEDWVLVSGQERADTFGYSSTFEVERYRRNFVVNIPGATSDEPTTLLLPPWTATPSGWSCKVRQPMSLTLDFSSMGPSVGADITDHQTGSSASVRGAALALSTTQPVEIVIDMLAIYEDAPPNVYVAMEIKPYIPTTFDYVLEGV
ncbi:hypothetical protein [Pseudomonas sp. Marseille-QA0892]